VRLRRYAAGEVIAHEGDPADTLHLVRSGRVAVGMATLYGNQVTFTLLGPGEVFGELALLGRDSRRSATLTALEATETVTLSKTEFDRLREQRAVVGRSAAQVGHVPGALPLHPHHGAPGVRLRGGLRLRDGLGDDIRLREWIAEDIVADRRDPLAGVRDAQDRRLSGLRDGVDCAKCLALGASACGLARELLLAAQADRVGEAIATILEQLRIATWLSGAAGTGQLGPEHLR